MFVRGGVYRVVKEAMGGTLAKLSVSALLFDYILTGPTSGVSAGQYIIGWLVDFFHLGPDSFLATNQNLLAAGIAVAITVYFWRVNLKGIHESSDQALQDHGRDDRHGDHHDRLVRRHAGGASREAPGAAADPQLRPEGRPDHARADARPARQAGRSARVPRATRRSASRCGRPR